MIFTKAPLSGTWIIDPEPLRDERGHFARTFDAEEFRSRGLDPRVVQESISFNARAGTLRGLHYQTAPYEEAKLIRCTRGAVVDVVVDLRPSSPTRRQWFSVELSEESARMVYVPEGLAHGFQTLRDGTELHYRMNREHSLAHARGIRFDDPELGIEWPVAEHVVSERDRALPALSEALGPGR